MKVSEKWLREWVNPAMSTDELAERITMAGLEVDGVEPAAGDFNGVVVAEIVAAEPHPDADKLQVCQVNNGEKIVQVVCGAPNARVGLKAPLAKVGAVLPGDFAIKQAKLRGVESSGMLCGASELGMEDLLDGLMELPADAPVGKSLTEYLQLDDQVIEIDLTPNRSDCLSVEGIARDVAALTETPMSAMELSSVTSAIDDVVSIDVQAAADCPRYLCRVIKGVDLSKVTPLWMVERLRRAGIRSIDAVVDVTNYVMIELGQPLHAFDLANIDGGIVVRKAAAKEKLVLLDGSELELDEQALLIADHSKGLALAGIMGGENSGVSESTQDILLESAFFAPILMAGRAREYGMHTDASHRFERGVDFELPRKAIERATALLLEIVGGLAGPVNEAVAEEFLPVRDDVAMRAQTIRQLLALELSDQEIESMLTNLGFQVNSQADVWQVSVPTWRFDIAIEADLVEEVARVFGYNNLPVSLPKQQVRLSNEKESKVSVSSIRSHLSALGYQEVISYSFIDEASQQVFCPENKSIKLQNPIAADMSVMRGSLIPGLVKAAVHNLNRQIDRVRVFETGLRFVVDERGERQEAVIAGLITGSDLPESWSAKVQAADFYDIKGDLESLISLSSSSHWSFVEGEHVALHPGQTAELRLQERAVGVVGALHPAVLKHYSISQPVFVFELELGALQTKKLPSFFELSKYPAVRRDLAFVVDQFLPVAEIEQLITSVAGELLREVKIFDVYQGKGIETQRKSVALGLTFQHTSRTLEELEINQLIDRIVEQMATCHNAQLRA